MILTDQQIIEYAKFPVNFEAIITASELQDVHKVHVTGDGYADYIILTGGEVKDTNYAEADELIEYALEKDVPENIIFKESKSRDTYENAVYSQEIMQEENWQTALVATSDYHTKRACKVFRKLNMNVKCIAAEIPQYNLYQKLEYFKSILREYGATIYYWIRGRI